MPTENLVKVGGQIRFFITGTFNPGQVGTNLTIGTPTDVVMTNAGVVNGAARMSNKVDLGAVRADRYELMGCVDYGGETPAAAGTVDYLWMPSTSGTAANGNIAGGAGVDADAPDGTMLGSITLAELLFWCQVIGSLRTHNGAVVQNGPIGVFSPTNRYGNLLMVNNGGAPFEGDDIEMHQVMNPIVDEFQDA